MSLLTDPAHAQALKEALEDQVVHPGDTVTLVSPADDGFHDGTDSLTAVKVVITCFGIAGVVCTRHRFSRPEFIPWHNIAGIRHLEG